MSTINYKIKVLNSAKDAYDIYHIETNSTQVYDFSRAKWLDEIIDDMETKITNIGSSDEINQKIADAKDELRDYIDSEIDKIEILFNVASETFTSTEGQTEFTLANINNLNTDFLEVQLGGVEQYIPDNYTKETNEQGVTKIILSEPIPEGIEVRIEYFGGFDAMNAVMESHIGNDDIHVTKEEKDKWNYLAPFEADIDDNIAKASFIDAMNKKAREIGMTNSNFVNAHGLGDTAQVTTARDLLMLGINSIGYNDLLKVWRNKSYAVNILGERQRTVTMETTVVGELLDTEYKIIGGKTGSLSGDDATINLLSIVKTGNDNWYIGVVLNAESNRFLASKENFDTAQLVQKENKEVALAKNLFSGGDFKGRFDAWTVNSGSPTFSDDVYYLNAPSLVANSNGTSSQVIRGVSVAGGNKYYVSCMVNCTRYVSGMIGCQLGTVASNRVGAERVTNGFEKFSAIIAPSSDASVNMYAGGINSADLDGYVDDIRIINLTSIYGAGNEPSKEELDNLILSDVSANSSAVCEVPKYNPFMYSDDIVDVIFEKNSNALEYPASITKVLTALVVLDNVQNLNHKFKLKSSDIKTGSGSTYYNGDIVTFKDALHCIMLESSNTMAEALSRVVGRKIYLDNN